MTQKQAPVPDLELDAIEEEAYSSSPVELPPNTVLALVAECRELRRLKSALEFLLLRDNWYLKNTCGICVPCESGAQSVLNLAKERDWKEGT